MAIFTPFLEALRQLRGTRVMPTALGSAELQTQYSAAARRRSFTSARTLLTDLLESYRRNVESIINPTIERDPDRVTENNPEGFVTRGMDMATARLKAKQLLQKLGYRPDPTKRGGVQDLSSDKRINLVLNTNVQLMQGAGHFIQGNDEGTIEAFPCWELKRFEDREEKRDWPHRFRIASQVANDVDAARVLEQTGRMIARKDSGIWQELGNGAGGYMDTLGNPYPPFAFSTGMWVQDVAYEDAELLGLVNINTRIQRQSMEAGEIIKGAA
jgi:hypothetical protein